ncbi:protein of unknown function [Pseudomonas mediterranea]
MSPHLLESPLSTELKRGVYVLAAALIQAPADVLPLISHSS